MKFTPTLKFFVLLSLILCGLAASAQNRVEVIKAIQQDVSRPLREISERPDKREKHEKREHQLPPKTPHATVTDPVVQSSPIGQLAPATAGNFDGIGQGSYGFVVNSAPPDTNGAVGATQYVQWVNSSYAVFDKITGVIEYGPTAGNSLWTGFGGACETNNDGDPILQYDKAANRWVMSQFSVSTTPYLQCFAISTTTDATGTYNRYAFQMPNLPDYPKIGIWPDAYYASFNMFSGQTFVGGRACAFDRSAMLAGRAATALCFQLSNSYGGLLPSDLDGSTPPPAGSPNFFLAYDVNALFLWKFHADFSAPANSTFIGPTNIPVAAFNEACNGGGGCIPQLGTTQQLDSLGDRLMYRLAYRNYGDHEALVVNHSVTAGTTVGLRWYELRTPNSTPTVFQQGTYAPDSSFRWLGSFAMDKMGNAAMGYSVSNSGTFPSIRFTGRAPLDPPGAMQAETTIMAGSGSQDTTLGRWGDYSSMSIDPVDDCTFWYTTEYLKSTGTFNWSTRIANFKFPNCSPPDFSISGSPSSQTISPAGSTSYSVTVTPAGGFNGQVSFSVSGLPAGTTATFNPSSLAGSGSTTLTVTPTRAAAGGTYPLTITGTSGSTSHNAPVTLIVALANTPPTADSVSPSAGTAASQTFAFKFSSANGSGNLTSVYGLINSSINGAGGCFLQYYAPGSILYLVNDAGNGVSGTLTPGAATSINNSQCTISGTGFTASGSGNQLTLTIPIAFSNGFIGLKNVYGYASDQAGLNSGWQQLGTWSTHAVANTPPTADSVSPSAGTAASQTFAFKYSSASGSGYLSSVYGLIHSSINGAGGCFFLYYAPGSTLYLYNDADTGVSGTLTPGAATSVSNSQCTISGGTLTASGSGNQLTLTIPIAFGNSFTGFKNVYGYASDQGGLNSGWQQLGTWTAQATANTPPTADSVSPGAGTGAGPTLTFKYSSAKGSGYLSAVYGLIHTSINGAGGCFFQYYAPSGTLYLYNDADNGVAGTLAPGAAASVNNSQCTINGGMFTASGSGNQLTLAIPITFSGTFSGAKNVYGYASDQGGLNSGWQQLGVWTVP